MITIFSGTNRPSSLTLKYAKHCAELLGKKSDEVQLFSLEDLPDNMVNNQMYSAEHQDDALISIIDKYVDEADAFFFVIPEYNGSYPGILKTFIDAISIRSSGNMLANKKAAILGVASGRAGNLRGIDQLIGVLHHMNCHVMPKAIPLGQSNKALDESGRIVEEGMLKTLAAYTDKFSSYCMEKSVI